MLNLFIYSNIIKLTNLFLCHGSIALDSDLKLSQKY